MLRLLHRLRREDDGFTLIEQLVTLAMLSIVVSAILGLADVAQRVAPADNERNYTVRETQVGLDQITSELSQAYTSPVISNGGFRIAASIVLRGRDLAVTFDCSGLAAGSTTLRRCTRTAGGVTQTVIPRMANPNGRPPFTASLRPGDTQTTYVRAVLEVPATGERTVGQNHRVVLDDGFYLRNVDGLH